MRPMAQCLPYICHCPAKINVRLKVVGKREDGYHDLESIMVPVCLCDRLEFYQASKGQTTLKCTGRLLPPPEENLVYAAAREFFSASGIEPGIEIRLQKKIPVAAGLGGGSSNAAFTLTALNEIFGHPLPFKTLKGLARRLGADVPFFLRPTPSLARGIGDVLTPIENWPSFWYVIVVPPIQVSTSWAYSQLKLELTKSPISDILKRLRKEDFQVSLLLENDLESVTVQRHPEIEEIKRHLIETGAEGALMSGSGPSVFGLFLDRDMARKAADALKRTQKGEVFIVTQWEAERSNKKSAAGVSSSGKTRAFGARIRRFESSHPSHFLCGNEPES